MATRATYKVIDKNHHIETVFYIHHDGYKEGAASYFHQLFAYRENLRGGLASRFLRAIENSEITSSHKIHGDTQFRYNLIQEGHETFLECLERVSWDECNFNRAFYGNIFEFINQFSGEEPYFLIKESFRNYWATKSQLEKFAAEARVELENYKERFPDMTGNISSLENKYQSFVTALENIKTKGGAQ